MITIGRRSLNTFTKPFIKIFPATLIVNNNNNNNNNYYHYHYNYNYNYSPTQRVHLPDVHVVAFPCNYKKISTCQTLSAITLAVQPTYINN